MENRDFYSSPKTDVEGPAADDGLSRTEIILLYNYSRSIGCLGVLWLLGGLFLVAITFGIMTEREYDLVLGIFIFGVAAICLAGGVGMFTRPGWARILGIVLCGLGLLNIYDAKNFLGVLISAIGLYTLIKSQKLFGPDRISHAELKLRKSRAR